MSSDNTTGNGRIPRKLLCGFTMLHLRHSLFWILKFQEKALLRLAECYRTLTENELCDPCSAGDLLSRASEYEQQAQAWELPEEL